MTKPTQIVAVPNSFSFALLDQEIDANGSGNVVVSPASVSFALAMTMNGSCGTTREGMLKALGFKSDSALEGINEAFAALLADLKKSGDVQLNVANALWTKKGLTIKAPFLAANTTHFGASVEALDFHQKAAAMKRMNGWVDENTKGKITGIIDDIPSPADVIMYLMNAVYFKGMWTTEFDKKLTKDEPFHLVDKSKCDHPLMHRSGDFGYFENSEFQAVALPYGKAGRRFGMYVFLPKETGAAGLSAFTKKLQKAPFDTWMSSFCSQEGDVFLPRFKLEYKSTLNDSLKKLGMSEAFDENAADFSDMVATPPRALISEVKHKTFIDVNEEGTEAAAVTSVGMAVLTSIRMPEVPFVLRADRPFYFFIRDNHTGTVLFAGLVRDPRS